MDKLPESSINGAIKSAQLLERAAAKLPILRAVSWDAAVKTRFLADGRLPTPNYNPVDTSQAREVLGSIKIDRASHPVHDWLRRVHGKLTTTANLLDHRGTADFFTYSRALYGAPDEVTLDGRTTVIDLAEHMERIFAGMSLGALNLGGADKTFTATEFAKNLTPPLKRYFGDEIPKVLVVDSLSAKAIAGSKRIRLREDATFTDRDLDQLLQHEAYIHAGTAKNGQRQDAFPILGRAHAGTTEIQEGLAVFAEIISGAMDPHRFRRLSDRIHAISMSAQGADFKQVFEFYMSRNDNPSEAYNNTFRVFRGGVVTGGAPFTKDIVYLKGLMRVHNFLRTVVSLERADLIRLLFVGKLDVEDIPALAYLRKEGLIHRPKYLPPWVKDLRFLVSYLAYSAFLNKVKLPGFQRYYADALKEVPNIWEDG
ncbi:MAG: flavohemoglobin expression-modulating QEGLA motif protein [Maricaulaceae bacterium]